MKNKIIILTFIIITMLWVTGCSASEEIKTEVVCTNIEELYPIGMTYVENATKEDLLYLIDICNERKVNAHAMANAARWLGYSEDHKIIALAKEEWTVAETFRVAYAKDYDAIIAKEEEEKRLAIEKENQKWASKEAEYPEATYVWRYMKNLGWNDYVCAGIMGNMMAEVGGQTLNLQPRLQGTYYGICQWSREYGEVWGADLATQCNFLRDTIKYEIDTYGFKYYKGFKYANFLNLTNEKEAALAFAKSYERCASFSYGVRQSNATKALNYFTN